MSRSMRGHRRAEAEGVAREIAAAGGKAVVDAWPTSPMQRDAARMMKETAEAFGGIDILVNNAAMRHEAALADLDLAQWRATMASILDGAYICTRACLPYLRKSRSAAIINIGGMTAIPAPSNARMWSAAKAGLERPHPRAWLMNWRRDGITVNCVVPGMVETLRGGSAPARRAP